MVNRKTVLGSVIMIIYHIIYSTFIDIFIDTIFWMYTV